MSQLIRRSTARVTMRTSSTKLNKAMFIPTTPNNLPCARPITITWDSCSRLLAPNRSPLTTNHLHAHAEVLSSCSSTSAQSPLSLEWVDGLTTSGLEIWFSITNSWSVITLVTLKFVTSTGSQVQNSPLSTMYTPDTSCSNWVLNGLMLLKHKHLSILSRPKNKWHMYASTRNTISLRSVPSSTSSLTPVSISRTTSTHVQSTCLALLSATSNLTLRTFLMVLVLDPLKR